MTEPTDSDLLRTWIQSAGAEITAAAVDATVEALIKVGLDEEGAGQADTFGVWALLGAEVRILIGKRLRELTCDVPLSPEPTPAA